MIGWNKVPSLTHLGGEKFRFSLNLCDWTRAKIDTAVARKAPDSGVCSQNGKTFSQSGLWVKTGKKPENNGETTGKQREFAYWHIYSGMIFGQTISRFALANDFYRRGHRVAYRLYSCMCKLFRSCDLIMFYLVHLNVAFSLQGTAIFANWIFADDAWLLECVDRLRRKDHVARK